MSPTAQANAELTAVAGGGSTDAWTPAEEGAGPATWTGSERVYYREERVEVEGAAADVLVRRELIVPTALADAAGLEDGESVGPEMTATFAPDGLNGDTARIRGVERRALAGVPASLATTRITLEDA